MKTTNLLYDKLAEYYDVIYAKKNFRAEAEWIYNYLKHSGLSRNATLLDVSCGTGRHIEYWQKFYQCVGVDLSNRAIGLAKKRVPGASFIVADMQTLKLGTKFDVVTCLFGSIAYVRTLSKLRRALRVLSEHTKANGSLIIEPWISPKKFISGYTSSNCFKIKNGAMCRLSRSHKLAGEADVDERYFITHNGNAQSYHDVHHLGLFDITTICKELKLLGFNKIITPSSNFFPHGMIIARNG